MPLFTKMREAGYAAHEGWNYWRSAYGSLAQVESRIAELEQHRSVVEQQLNGVLREPVEV